MQRTRTSRKRAPRGKPGSCNRASNLLNYSRLLCNFGKFETLGYWKRRRRALSSITTTYAFYHEITMSTLYSCIPDPLPDPYLNLSTPDSPTASAAEAAKSPLLNARNRSIPHQPTLQAPVRIQISHLPPLTCSALTLSNFKPRNVQSKDSCRRKARPRLQHQG